MDFFDNAVNKAKEVFDVAYKKTNEVVTTQKQKFDVASVESKRNKDYMQLGEIYFNILKDTEIEDERVRTLVEQINEKNEKIQELTDEINAAKNKKICPNCSASIDENSIYCNVCGAKTVFDSEEE